MRVADINHCFRVFIAHCPPSDIVKDGVDPDKASGVDKWSSVPSQFAEINVILKYVQGSPGYRNPIQSDLSTIRKQKSQISSNTTLEPSDGPTCNHKFHSEPPPPPACTPSSQSLCTSPSVSPPGYFLCTLQISPKQSPC